MKKSASELEEKFLSVIQDNKKLIYKVCNLYCKDSEDRKDLQQEIIIQIWRSFETYNEKYKLSTWLYKIALNTAISFYRKESRRDQKHSSEDEIIHVIYNNADSPDEELDRKIEMLYKYINEFNKLDRALMILYLDNYGYKEISEILGITETNVATKISRIKNNLKKQFSNFNN